MQQCALPKKRCKAPGFRRGAISREFVFWRKTGYSQGVGRGLPPHRLSDKSGQSMPSIIDVHRTYKYALYKNAQANRRLHDTINVSGIIWNHITALRKRYYRRFGRHLNSSRLQAHVSHLRMRTQRYGYWQMVGSQALQDICQRHDKAYARLFKK